MRQRSGRRAQCTEHRRVTARQEKHASAVFIPLAERVRRAGWHGQTEDLRVRAEMRRLRLEQLSGHADRRTRLPTGGPYTPRRRLSSLPSMMSCGGRGE